ncbi:MAG TPA: hypothetical protein VJK51_00570 [Candidatus Nanoarchaeia archaeon]|nr:hypothetical protein [Candidatus Nanoarchaeia archaeon]
MPNQPKKSTKFAQWIVSIIIVIGYGYLLGTLSSLASLSDTSGVITKIISEFWVYLLIISVVFGWICESQAKRIGENQHIGFAIGIYTLWWGVLLYYLIAKEKGKLGYK